MASKEQRELHKLVEQARNEIAALEGKRGKLQSRLAAMAEQRHQYELLDRVCESLDELDKMGAAHLFWGKGKQPKEVTQQVAEARAAASTFVQKIREIEQQDVELSSLVRDEEAKIVDCLYEIDELQEAEEEARSEFVMVRELAAIPYRHVVMPWEDQEEDRRRLHKAMSVAMLVLLCLGVVVKLWVFPPEREREVVEIPKQLVRLVQNERPKPPENQPQKEVEPTKDSSAKPATAETQKARAKAMTTGVLAFKEGFSDLIQDAPSLKLGADASIKGTGGSGPAGPGAGTRALVVAQGGPGGGSGGISAASISRGVGVGGGNGRMGPVGFSRVQSEMGAAAGADRPLSSGAGPSRGDEEIQIVFDRYKASLYRIYNRELRNNPSLRGKIILRITIEPSGEVSACRVESTDLDSKTLVAEIVERVRKFNFGVKEGVPKTTILYPIDLLPSSS